jgi:hypothetical protein
LMKGKMTCSSVSAATLSTQPESCNLPESILVQ